jgi:hypothetical protein
MKWTKIEERRPEFSGWYLCRIGDKDGHRLPLRISAGLICDVAGKVYMSDEVEWLDEESPEPDQDSLWKEFFALADTAIVNKYGGGLDLPSSAKSKLKKLYIISRKKRNHE